MKDHGYIFFKLKYSWFTIIQVYSKVIQLYIYIFFFRLFFIIGYYKMLSTVAIGLCYLSILYIVACISVARKIPWMEKPGRLQSMGSLRVGHDWATSLSLSTFMHWRRKWQPTPVFLPGESQGRGSLVGCRLWGRTESGTTEVT